MNKNRVLYIFTFSLLFLQCDIITGSKSGSSWENLNFPEQSVYVLFLDGNDLYAGAGYDGLWVLDISRSNAEWEYLGHRVTEGERHFSSGVQAIDVYDGEIRIRSETVADNGRGVGIWLSKDRGKTWEPSDQGISTDRYDSFWPRDFTRSPHNPNLILAGAGSVFRSEDGGEQWYRVYPEPEFPYRVYSLYFGLVWHPTKANIIWAYGETNRFQPWLMRSTDSGITWERFPHINVPRDNAFYSMAFDSGNPDIIYIGAQAGVISSTKGGEEWMGEDPVPALFTDKQGGFFYAMVAHPRISGILFAGAGPRVYGSKNYGETVSILNTPPELTFILDMWYDENTDMLYVAGDGGVFRLRSPVVHIP